MLRRKKVAVIGAGPAGLVTAKTLLRNFPDGTFAPTIFESRHEIGGLWPSSRSIANGRAIFAEKNDFAGMVNPSMRTNLSRYTVAFSDLSWESVFDSQDVPMFPQAWQVGMYLEEYVERYIPSGVIRLGHTVVQTVRRDAERRWTVKWVLEGDQKEQREVVMSECFDYLVVASGYFSTPYIPDIPGLSEYRERAIHSSALDIPGSLQKILQEPNTAGGKLVVIGGSLSGAEAASALALYLSSRKYTSTSSKSCLRAYEVHHVSTKPFWAIPTYLPQSPPVESPDKEDVSFLPLDLALYNLSHRPPGPVQYSFGPLSVEQIAKFNNNFRALLGREYENCGHITSKCNRPENDKPQPTFLAIGNDYAEFVRSKAISPTIGRVCGITRSPSGSAGVEISLPDGQITRMDDVAATIMATGFKPNNSLSFLPDEVLSTLEYLSGDTFLPLVLDGKGSMHTDIPDLGFVGFYKGPYWGAMEMQARLLGDIWVSASPRDGIYLSDTEKLKRAEERQAIRDFRSADPNVYRSQLPMADYTGMMESLARDLGIPRAQLTGSGERHGPVVPARFAFDKTPPGPGRYMKENQVKTTLGSLRTTLNPKNSTTSPGMALAIFRALHGTWNFTRTWYKAPSRSETKISGAAAFHPRYPTKTGYDKEYLCEETAHDTSVPSAGVSSRSVCSLLDPLPRPDGIHIHVRLADGMNLNTEDQFSHALKLSPARQKVRDGEQIPGEYTVHASGSGGRTGRGHSGGIYQYEYVFNMEGVAITSWECCIVCKHPGGDTKDGDAETRTSYTR